MKRQKQEELKLEKNFLINKSIINRFKFSTHEYFIFKTYVN